jgi:bacterioferritin (cytochrome b1)
MKNVASRIAFSPALEGNFATSVEDVIALLCDILLKKYEIDNAYRSFADRVRGPFRDALVDHWQEHAKEERTSAYDFAMKIMGLGGDPQVCPTTCSITNPTIDTFCQKLAEMELELIKMNRDLAEIAGENTALRVLAENTILQDTQHLDDLRRMSLVYVG